MKLSIITLLLILLLCGCSTHPQNENGKFIRIDIENSANNPFNLSNLSKEVSYIKLETNDSCLINSIKAIFYIDNQIIIRDNNSILFFLTILENSNIKLITKVMDQKNIFDYLTLIFALRMRQCTYWIREKNKYYNTI